MQNKVRMPVIAATLSVGVLFLAIGVWLTSLTGLLMGLPAGLLIWSGGAVFFFGVGAILDNLCNQK